MHVNGLLFDVFTDAHYSESAQVEDLPPPSHSTLTQNSENKRKKAFIINVRLKVIRKCTLMVYYV